MNKETAKLLEQPTITVDEAAKVLGVSRLSAYAAVKRGELDVIRIGKRMVVTTAPLRRRLGVVEAV